MSISLRMLLTADGKQAKAEVAGVTAAVQKAGTASDGLSTKATKASVATTNLGRASATAANQVQPKRALQEQCCPKLRHGRPRRGRVLPLGE